MRRAGRRTATTATITAAAILALPALATAAAAATGPGRAATPAEAKAIDSAVRHSPMVSAVRPTDFRVTGDRVSKRNPAWVFATVMPTHPHQLDPATVVLQRHGSRWTARELGTAQVGCDVAPAAVRAEFHLDCG